MKKWMIGVVAIILVLIGGFALFAPRANNAIPSAEAFTPAAQNNSNVVVSDARVVPVQYANLSFAATGNVMDVLVKEGDAVKAGQVLARLNNARAQANVAQAQATLSRAEAQLAQLVAGALKQEIAAAKAAVDAADAQLARIQQPARSQEIAAGQAELAAARATLQKVLEGATPQQLIAAQADLSNAEAAVRQAQTAYDRVKGDPNIGARPEALQLQQATNNYEAAKARYDELKKGATAAEIAQARAQVQRAQASLNTLQAPARAADIAAAQAEIRRAQAQLDLIEAGTRPELITAAKADVDAAKAGLQLAQAALTDTELKAPFAGIVASLNAKIGEQVAPGSISAQVADLSAWQIETEDLTELGVVNIKEGDTVKLSFDAIPDLQTTGKVLRIKPVGQSKQGDIVYTVVIQPEKSDARLRWNMTAAVTIEK